jgi:hypothetical protein
MALPKRDSQCKGKVKSGRRCRAAATSGGLCFFHANPNKASELGRIGGRSKGLRAAEPADPLPVLNNAVAVRDTVAKLITDVHAGKLHPKVAATLAPLLNLQLRAIETTKLERRVAAIEKWLLESEANAETDADSQGGEETPSVTPSDSDPSGDSIFF